jgi:3-dehydroquinate dehydratase-1
MANLEEQPALSIGPLRIGSIPRVVGTVSDPEFLERFSWQGPEFPCDIVELRLDQMHQVIDWEAWTRRIESIGWPVIITIRLKSEGGAWDRPDQERRPAYLRALEVASAIDVEARSSLSSKLAEAARQRGKAIILSWHDFQKTPSGDELGTVIGQSENLGGIVKITTLTQTRADVKTLKSLLERRWKSPLCVMGMGPIGSRTRIDFPLLGSALTYGYLDRPNAPGQLGAGEVTVELRRASGAYADEYVRRHAKESALP